MWNRYKFTEHANLVFDMADNSNVEYKKLLCKIKDWYLMKLHFSYKEEMENDNV